MKGAFKLGNRLPDFFNFGQNLTVPLVLPFQETQAVHIKLTAMSSSSQPTTRPPGPFTFCDLMESLAHDEMVNVVLNHDGTVLKIQRTLLRDQSPWFEKALTSGFIEGQSLTLRFPGVPSDVVQTFVYWMFRGHMPWDEDNSVDRMFKTHEELQALLARLWMFGEEHQLPKLQSQAMWGLCEQLEYTPPAVELLLEVYEGTAPDSPLREVMVNEAASGWSQQPQVSNQKSPTYSREDLDRLGAIPGFTADFAMALERQVRERASVQQ
ncbi:hypothetical protein KC316_g4056 [Hortaea werneckii]|nr:hypothetical protein KC324_g6368 [Hortaea werneckii]KAI7589242.1 hypothetical protein KC316_g4056 [Hortaea werneckii]